MRTLKFRIKSNTVWLDQLSIEINFIWNYINNLSSWSIKNKSKFLSEYDMHPYLVGATEYLNLLTGSIKKVANEYVKHRIITKKCKLRYRGKKSLGWIPFNSVNNLRLRKGQLFYGKNKFKVWDSYELENYELTHGGSFNQDSRGNWYLNLIVDDKIEPSKGQAEVGIDLGLKTFATLSSGEKVEAQQVYRELEPKLQIAQRANKKKRVRAIHAKIKNRRKDFQHKLSTKLITENAVIFVGNVNSSKLAKTKMAKSVLDAGWSQFRTMLAYKSIRKQVWFQEINESGTSLTCNACKSRTGPTGLGELGIREWTCSECGSVHDRDINAAKNILALGLQRLAEGNPLKKDAGQ